MAWLLTQVLHQRIYRNSTAGDVGVRNAYGPVLITLKLPGTHGRIAEPLVTCGKVGNATLAFLKNLQDGNVRLGVEFWGAVLSEGPEFAVASPQAVIHLACYFPALYPEVGDPAWGGVPLELQRIRRSTYYITVDGVVRLTGTINYDQGSHPRIYFAVNPLGGSVVSDRLTGTVLQAVQRAP